MTITQGVQEHCVELSFCELFQILFMFVSCGCFSNFECVTVFLLFCNFFRVINEQGIIKIKKNYYMTFPAEEMLLVFFGVGKDVCFHVLIVLWFWAGSD